jgi:hypothetical protein
VANAAVKRRKAGASHQDAQPRKRRLVGQCAFRRFASLLLPEANLFLEWRRGGAQNSDAEASRE